MIDEVGDSLGYDSNLYKFRFKYKNLESYFIDSVIKDTTYLICSKTPLVKGSQQNSYNNDPNDVLIMQFFKTFDNKLIVKVLKKISTTTDLGYIGQEDNNLIIVENVKDT